MSELSSLPCIIPARGGSKSIPGKNLALLGGRPLLAWSIAAAQAARRIGRVYVSTENAEIAAVARGCGAAVIDRPVELAGDRASSEGALLHALGVVGSEGPMSAAFVFMQCTSPLTSAEDLDDAIARFEETGSDCIFAALMGNHFLWTAGPDGAAVAVNHDPLCRPMRQDRPPQYLETGAFYVIRTAGFLRARHRFFGRIMAHPVPAHRTVDIDEPEDLRLAAAIVSERPDDGQQTVHS